MLRLKLLQDLPLPLLITRQPAHLLLPLIIHHLLDHGPRLAIQIAQLGRLRRDLAHINLGRGRHNMRPPFYLVDFVEVQGNFFSGGLGCCFEGPAGFVYDDGVGEFALSNHSIS